MVKLIGGVKKLEETTTVEMDSKKPLGKIVPTDE